MSEHEKLRQDLIAARRTLHAIAYGPPTEGDARQLLNEIVELARAALPQPEENDLFEIYIKEGLCDSLPFKCSLSRLPSDGYYAALRIWHARNRDTEPVH